MGRGYNVESNKEKGLGRPDILLKDKRNRRAVIIEAKKSKKKADMDKDCAKAIDQIITEKYAEGLYGLNRYYVMADVSCSYRRQYPLTFLPALFIQSRQFHSSLFTFFGMQDSPVSNCIPSVCVQLQHPRTISIA